MSRRSPEQIEQDNAAVLIFLQRLGPMTKELMVTHRSLRIPHHGGLDDTLRRLVKAKKVKKKGKTRAMVYTAK